MMGISNSSVRPPVHPPVLLSLPLSPSLLPSLFSFLYLPLSLSPSLPPSYPPSLSPSLPSTFSLYFSTFISFLFFLILFLHSLARAPSSLFLRFLLHFRYFLPFPIPSFFHVLSHPRDSLSLIYPSIDPPALPSLFHLFVHISSSLSFSFPQTSLRWCNPANQFLKLTSHWLSSWLFCSSCFFSSLGRFPLFSSSAAALAVRCLFLCSPGVCAPEISVDTALSSLTCSKTTHVRLALVPDAVSYGS